MVTSVPVKPFGSCTILNPSLISYSGTCLFFQSPYFVQPAPRDLPVHRARRVVHLSSSDRNTQIRILETPYTVLYMLFFTVNLNIWSSRKTASSILSPFTISYSSAKFSSQKRNIKACAAAEAEEALRAVNAVSANPNGVAKPDRDGPSNGGAAEPRQEELHSFEIEAAKVDLSLSGISNPRYAHEICG